MSQRAFRIFAPVLSLIAYGIAFCQLNSEIDIIPLPTEWRSQFLFLLAISLFSSLLLPFCKNKTLIWVLMSSSALIVVVIGLPMSRYLGVELTLATVLFIEAFEYLTLKEGAIFSTVLLGIMLGVQYLPINAWGIKVKAPLNIDLWSFGVYDVIVIILSAIIRFQRNSHVSAAQIKKTYQEITFQLSQVNMQLQEYAITVQQETLLNERKRILREIHDTVAYTLTNLVMMLEAAKYIVKHTDKKLYEHLELARGQANNGLTEVHRVLQDLQPVQLSKTSGLHAIQELVTTFKKATQIEIDLNLGNAPLNFGDEAELVAYRFVQEGITNALRHGRATKISISISLFNQKIHILIRDNGVGTDNLKEGYGLSGMRERIERLGGQLQIASDAGSGFRLLAIIPVKGVE